MIFVFVSGGIVNNLRDATTINIDDYAVIDYDSEESGECPVCQEELKPGEDTELICVGCGYNSKKDTDETAIEKYLKYWKEA